MGTFSRVVGLTRFGRPVYKNADKYLFYLGAKRHWMIGPDYTKDSGWVHAQPSNAVGAHLVPAGSWFEHLGNGKWKANLAIAATCKTAGTYRVATDHVLPVVLGELRGSAWGL
jgi:hypothetical protein